MLLWGLAVAFAGSSQQVLYIAYHKPPVLAEIPAGSRQKADGSFQYLHDHMWTSFEIDGGFDIGLDEEPDCNGRKPAYQLNKGSVSAYSCYVGNFIRYRVKKFGHRLTKSNAAVAGTIEIGEFSIDYPLSQRVFWDPVVAHISKSLQVGAR